MNINKFHNELLEALGDTTGANDINEFRVKFVAAMADLVADAVTNQFDATDARNAIKTKTQIAALTGGSTAANIVTALQA